jgi:hypothetical protein
MALRTCASFTWCTAKVIRVLHGKRDINRILEGETAQDDMVH